MSFLLLYTLYMLKKDQSTGILDMTVTQKNITEKQASLKELRAEQATLQDFRDRNLWDRLGDSGYERLAALKEITSTLSKEITGLQLDEHLKIPVSQRDRVARMWDDDAPGGYTYYNQ